MSHTIGIVDDHTMFRKGLAEIIAHFDNFEVVLEAGDGVELMEKLKSDHPDILLIDIKMPKQDGFESIQQIRTEYPDCKLIILSMFDQDNFILHAYQLGVNGYLLKNASPEELEVALKKVLTEGFYFTNRISTILATGLQRKVRRPGFSGITLTDREKEVLKLICDGLTTVDIGKRMYLSKRTIDSHRQSLLEKTGMHNTAALISWAFRNNLVE